MEISYYLFSFLAAFFLILVFRHIDKKRSNIPAVKKFIDKNLEDFRKIIQENKKDLDQACMDIDMFINRGNAISKTVNEQLQTINRKLAEMEKSEKSLNEVKTKAVEIKDYVDGFAGQINVLKKESVAVKSARTEVQELTKNFKEVARRSEELEKKIQEDMDAKKALLDRKLQEGIKTFENYLKSSLEEIKKDNNQKVSVIISKYQQNFKDWMDEKKKDAEELNHNLQLCSQELEKVKVNSIGTIEKEVKQKLGELDTFCSSVRGKVEDQGQKINALKEQVFVEFNQRFREFNNENTTILNYSKNEFQNLKDSMKKEIENFNREIGTHVNDISQKLSSFEDVVLKVDKIAGENESRITREIDSKIKDIDNGIKNKIESVQNRVVSTENSIKEVLKSFREKVSSEIQNTYHDVDLFKTNLMSGYKEVENKISTFISVSDNAIHSKIKEMNETYERGKASLDKGVNGLTLEVHKFGNSIKVDMRNELENYKQNLYKEREEISNEILSTIKSLESYKAELKKDFEENFMEVQKSLLENELTLIRNTFYDKQEEFVRSFNTKKDEIFSKLNEYQTLFETSLQKNDDKTKNFVNEFLNQLKNLKIGSEEKLDLFIKEGKNKIENLHSEVESIQFKMEDNMKKQKNNLVSHMETLKAKLMSQVTSIENNFKEKEKNMLNRVEEKSEIVAKRVGDLEEKLTDMKAMLYKEIGKNSEEIKVELMKLEKDFENQMKNSLAGVGEETVALKDEIAKIKDRADQAQKRVIKEIDDRFEVSVREIAKKVEDFEKSIFNAKIKHESYLNEFEQKLNNFKADKKLDKLVEELGNFENMLKKVKKEKDTLSDVERSFISLKKDSESLLNELGKFNVKKDEISNLNDRMNEMVSKSREAEERMNQFNRNVSVLGQVESKINKVEGLYDELQKKAEMIESKELKIRDIIQKAELNAKFTQDLQEESMKLKQEVETIFKKNDFLTNHIKDLQMRLEEMKKGEEKIDEVLSRFSELEILSMDMESRLKQMDNATSKLDAAEARIKTLLNIVDSPDTLRKAASKKVTIANNTQSHSVGIATKMNNEMESSYNVEALLKNLNPSKKDSIIRFNKSGHKTEVIANILEMRPEEVDAVIKYYAKR